MRSSRISPLPVLLGAGVASILLSRYTPLSLSVSSLFVYSLTIPLYIIYITFIYPFYLSPLRHIPTVPGNPLWGQVYDFINEECGVPARRYHEAHGPIIRYFFPFGAERLSVAGDEAIKQILINNPYKYIKHPASVTIAAGLLGLGLVFSEGAEHAKQRKAFSPAFSSQSIRDLTPIFWQKSFLLCNLWRKQIDAVHRSAHVEALQWLTRATLDMIGEAGFGQDINSLENPDAPIRQAYLKFLGVDIAARINHGLRILISVAKHIPTPANNILEASRQIIFNEATRIVHEKAAQAREGKAMRGDIISRITKDNFKLEEGGQEGLSIETMRDQSIGFESMEIFSPADAPRI